MIERSIARRYAKALVELGKTNNQLDDYLLHLEDLKQTFATRPDLFSTLCNRFTNREARLRIADAVLDKMGSSKNLHHFIKLLIVKGRIELFDLIVDAFKRFVFEHQNKCAAVVKTAKTLDDSAYSDIEQALSQYTGKTIVLERVTDPGILGGVSVQIGGRIFDDTVSAHLKRMSTKMISSHLD